MTLQAVLEDLVARLAAALPEVKTVDVWDGAWDVLKSPTRATLRQSAGSADSPGLPGRIAAPLCRTRARRSAGAGP